MLSLPCQLQHLSIRTNKVQIYNTAFCRGYVKPKNGLVKFAVRLRGKNVEVRVATSIKNVGKGKEEATGMTGIK